MNVEFDMVGLLQNDLVRVRLNNELRERFSRFRIVLVEAPHDLRAFDEDNASKLDKLEGENLADASAG